MDIKTQSKLAIIVVVALLAALAVESVQAQDAKPKTENVPGQSVKTASLPDQDTAATLRAAADALGMLRWSVRQIDALNTLEFWGTGFAYAIGQQYKPDGPWPAFRITYHASISYAAEAMRVDMTRSNPDGPILGGGGLPLAAPQRQIQVVSGRFAWNESEPGAGLVPGQGVATPALDAVDDRLLQLWITPYGVIKAAIKAGADTKMAKKNDGAAVIIFPYSGTTMEVTLNPKHLVERVETRSNNPVLGDMVTEVTYSDYADLGELKSDVMFPGHIVEKQGGFPVLDLRVTKDDPGNPYVVFPIPENVQKSFSEAGGQPVKVDVQKVAEGVWYLTGGTHHSVAVEFKDYLVLVECPLNDDRALAVMDKVKKTIQNKAIRYVVNTHHHFDHAGGLRACTAEGATIVTQAENKPYYEKVWSLPHAIKPDRLTETHKKPTFEIVTEKRVIADGTQRLELYHLQGSSHAESMLIGYLPKQKILIEADVYNPAPVNANFGTIVKENVNLYDNIKRLNLNVQQILPLHGRLVTIDDLRKTIGEKASSEN